MKQTGISLLTVAKMTKGYANMWKICTELETDIGEIVWVDRSEAKEK